MRNLRIFISLFFVLAIHKASAEAPLVPQHDSTFIYRSLAEAAQNPESVIRLNLSRLRLDSIPPLVFTLVNLQELDLSRNRIEELPKEIGGLKNLQRLNLSNNKLIDLPAEIGELQNLVYLGLNRNVIDSLPPEIGKLSQLEILELWDNELADLPDEISSLQNLKVLELRGILFSDEEQARIDSLIVKSAKIYFSPSCMCKY